MDLVRLAVIRTLAIPDRYCIFTGTDPNDTAIYGRGRRLADASYAFELTLLPLDEGEDSSVTPMDFVHLLDKRQDILLANLPSLDTSASISASAELLNSTNPDFVAGPDIVSLSYSSVRISAALNTAGAICGVILPIGSADPKSEQIIRGQNALNQNLPTGHAACVPAVFETPSTLEFTDLNDDFDYIVWVSGMNELPGDAEIM